MSILFEELTDTDHHLVVAKVRPSVSKQAMQKFYMERFNLKKRNYLEVTILNRFAASENLDDDDDDDDDDDVDVNRAWENIRENMKALAIEGYYELKQHQRAQNC